MILPSPVFRRISGGSLGRSLRLDRCGLRAPGRGGADGFDGTNWGSQAMTMDHRPLKMYYLTGRGNKQNNTFTVVLDLIPQDPLEIHYLTGGYMKNVGSMGRAAVFWCRCNITSSFT